MLMKGSEREVHKEAVGDGQREARAAAAAAAVCGAGGGRCEGAEARAVGRMRQARGINYPFPIKVYGGVAINVNNANIYSQGFGGGALRNINLINRRLRIKRCSAVRRVLKFKFYFILFIKQKKTPQLITYVFLISFKNIFRVCCVIFFFFLKVFF